MNRNEFERLLQLVLDGEADEGERRSLEAAMATNEAYRARFAFEQQLRGRLREALDEKPDMVARARVLAGFRAALEAEQPLETAPRATSASWRRFAIPAAAAAAVIFAFWLGGLSNDKDRRDDAGPRLNRDLQADLDRTTPNVGVVQAINVSEIHFREEIEAEKVKTGCPRRSTENCLKRGSDGKAWDQGCGVDCRKRLEEARQLVASCVGDDIRQLGIPEGFELVGMRRAKLQIGDRVTEVPHLVFVSERSRLSAYILCDELGTEVTADLHKLGDEDAQGERCLWGCPVSGLVVRRFGKAWIAISSEMGMDRLAELADRF